MSGPTAAEWASLKSGATQCTTSSEAIDGAIKRMISQLDGVQWKGAAATAFANAKLAVQADVQTITQRLEAIANGINKTSTSLMAADDDSRASLDNVAGGTGSTGTDVNGGSHDISAGLR